MEHVAAFVIRLFSILGFVSLAERSGARGAPEPWAVLGQAYDSVALGSNTFFGPTNPPQASDSCKTRTGI